MTYKRYKLYKCMICFLLIFILINTSPANAQDLQEELAGETKLRGMIFYGHASWYGPRFHGKTTSNGERFNKHDLTAAHKTLPFNTKVIVTNLKNKKTVVVRINDRGPFIRERIIDLSEEAASQIDLKEDGISYIKLQVISG